MKKTDKSAHLRRVFPYKSIQRSKLRCIRIVGLSRGFGTQGTSQLKAIQTLIVNDKNSTVICTLLTDKHSG